MLLAETLIVNLIEVENTRPLLKTFKRILDREWSADSIGFVCALATNPTI
jgi:hypothetical protein